MSVDAKVRFATLEDVLERMENGATFRLVEALKEEEFQEGHLPGAENIPLAVLGERAGRELGREEEIIVYCASYSCQTSTKAARLLVEMGYRNVLDFKGGKKRWRDEGLEIEGAAPEPETGMNVPAGP